MCYDADDQDEVDGWEQELNDGLITMAEYNKKIRDRQRDYMDAAEEAAQDAYQNELRNW